MTRGPALPEKLAAAAHEELESLGVRILVDTRVTEVDRKGVHTGDGELVPADIKVWAAGIRGADFLKEIGGLETTRSNQLAVGQTLQTTRDQRIFALGDCCACPRPDSDRPVPRDSALLDYSLRHRVVDRRQAERDIALRLHEDSARAHYHYRSDSGDVGEPHDDLAPTQHRLNHLSHLSLECALILSCHDLRRDQRGSESSVVEPPVDFGIVEFRVLGR